MTLADGSYWIYTYDRLGQVVSGKRYWQDGTPVAGQQFEYGFDDIGNRKTAATGGDASGTGLRVASYGANLLNQYTNRTVPGTVDILGVANPTAAVAVNGNTAYRKGDYFWQALSVGNSSAAQYPLVTTISQYGAKATNTGNVYLPQTPEVFTHDADGNLTQDGRWDYTWDGENRLIAMQTRSTVLASGVPEQRLDFAYDPQSRRISKTVSNKVSGAWSRIVAQRFLYDGWNLLAILNPQSSIVQSFAWGLDLSGSLQGAGGVGGLLWLNDATTINGQPSAHAPCYDGNGNVAALVNFADGSLSARYECGPFGEPIRQTGAMAEANPFCFSTKFTDNESGHLYYGYRYYLPTMGRWLSRDPLGERGSANILSFVHNNGIANVDYAGLKIIPPVPVGPHPPPLPAILPYPLDRLQLWPVELGGPWEMLFYYLFGNWDTDITISQELISIAKAELQPTEDGFLQQTRKSMVCGKSGHKLVSKHIESGFDMPNPHSDAEASVFWKFYYLFGLAHMGAWTLDSFGECKWHCAPCGPKCKCHCDISCSFDSNVNKIYTFNPFGYNPRNWGFFPVWSFAMYWQEIVHHNFDSVGYFISADFRTYRTATLELDCEN